MQKFEKLEDREVLIEFVKLQKYYVVGDTKQMVIKDIDLKIYQGEAVAILGKSGSGKSTLLNIIGLLDKPTGGHYYLNGKDINYYTGDELATLRSRTFGFIFQQFNLLNKLSVIENVVLPTQYVRDREKWNNRYKKAMELLTMVEIPEQAKKNPKLLSGGQQQRVAIARSLVNDPKVIIGDEPTGALDSRTADQIIGQIFELNRELGVTLILVTHDEDLAYKCGRVVVLKDGVIDRIEVLSANGEAPTTKTKPKTGFEELSSSFNQNQSEIIQENKTAFEPQPKNQSNSDQNQEHNPINHNSIQPKTQNLLEQPFTPSPLIANNQEKLTDQALKPEKTDKQIPTFEPNQKSKDSKKLLTKVKFANLKNKIGKKK